MKILPQSFGFLFLSIAVGIFVFSGEVKAQETGVSPSASAVEKEENFRLDITEKRTTEENYQRSTEIRIDNNRLNVGAGASVGARKINILLRGVKGEVTFRASLEPLRTRIEELRKKLQPSSQE